MTLLSFGFSPVFFSVMAFCIISRSKFYPQRTRNKVIVLILLTFLFVFYIH
ncbi:Microcin E492 immunity protein [Klebsiella pneumoniae subsp. pneumoniae 1084]|nr:Microcin E492 immunity protein [Klebsiella pneumoniae subsp. pneumoniae 1084]